MSKQATVYGPYSPVFKAGDTYFVSGQLGVDGKTKTAPKTIEEQTHLLFANLKQLLADNNLGLDNIVKTTIYLTDIDDFAKVNDIYMTYFNEPRPARACVQVAQLPKVTINGVPVLIEMDAVAYKEEKK